MPGLRHTRTPLIAGSLWLLIIWLIFGNRLVPDLGGGRVESLMYDLGARLGRPAMLAGLALLATLIGGMTPRLPVRLIARRLPINKRGRWWQAPVCWFFGTEPDLANARGEFEHWLFRRVSLVSEGLEWSQFAGKNCPAALQSGARDIQENGAALIGRERLARADFAGDNPTPRDFLMWGMADASIRTEVDSELPLQLHVERESLFYEYDRVRAESELRAAIVIPLLILIAILAAGFWLWAFALVIPIWLVRQAVQLSVEAEQQLLSAVRLEVVQSSTVAFIDSLGSDTEHLRPD